MSLRHCGRAVCSTSPASAWAFWIVFVVTLTAFLVAVITQSQWAFLACAAAFLVLWLHPGCAWAQFRSDHRR